VSIDCGVLKNGFYGDHAYTFKVGDVSSEVQKLLDIALASLYIGIKEFKKGKRVGDISNAIQFYNETNGYGVVRELVGHGLGRSLHESPEVPNFGKKGNGKKFEDGMVLAIEPMINMGTEKVNFLNDGWTVETADKLPSVHFEHDVAMINGKPILLSTFDFIYESLGIKSDEENEFKWNENNY
jgi:methionyl aminopeptidase